MRGPERAPERGPEGGPERGPEGGPERGPEGGLQKGDPGFVYTPKIFQNYMTTLPLSSLKQKYIV